MIRLVLLILLIPAMVRASSSTEESSPRFAEPEIWFKSVGESLKSYKVEQLSADVIGISDASESFHALLIDSSVWLTRSDLVIQADEETESRWEDDFDFLIRDHDVQKHGQTSRARRILKSDGLEFVLNEEYSILKPGKSYGLVVTSQLRDEGKALQLRQKISLLAKSSGSSHALLEQFLNLAIPYSAAASRSDAARASTARPSTASRGNLPDPACRNSGIKTQFQRRLGEPVPTVDELIINSSCLKSVGKTLFDQAKGTAHSVMNLFPLAAVIASPGLLLNNTFRGLAISGAEQSAQETAQMIRAFQNWYRANKGRYLQAIRAGIGLDSCLTKQKRIEYLCKTLTIVAEVPVGALAASKIAAVASAFKVAPIAEETTAAASVARLPSLTSTVGEKFVLYDAEGKRIPLSTIKNSESFQVVMTSDHNQIALLRGGVRNGGHRKITRIASNETRFEPTDMPAAGNIRFLRDSTGKWRTEVGGRWFTDDHPISARELAEFATEAGVSPTLVTPGRLPGWERAAH